MALVLGDGGTPIPGCRTYRSASSGCGRVRLTACGETPVSAEVREAPG